MDAKQFDLFQRTVQFAVDERRENPKGNSRFNMGTWFSLQTRNDRATKAALAETVFETVKVPNRGTWSVINQAPACRTTACLAGTGVQLHGADRIAFTAGSEVDGATAAVLTEDNKIMDIASRAAELFGFDEGDESIFYMVDAKMGTIVKRAREIATKHGHELEII